MSPQELERELRRLGWTGAEFGRRMGVSRMAVSRYRRGKRKIPEWVRAWLRDDPHGPRPA